MNTRRVDTSLLVVAMLAALANYEGLSLAIRAETVWQHAFCAAIALGVFTCIAVLWHVVFAVVPQMQDARLRIWAWLTTVVGALGILGMSAWWSVASLGGPAAQQAVYQEVVGQAETALATTKASGGTFQTLVPGLNALKADLDNLTACEGRKGCITSGHGAGGIAALLGQLRDKAVAILSAANGAHTTLGGMSDKAATCLTGMRSALSSDLTREREDELAKQVDCFNAALGDLGNVDGRAGIVQGLSTFTTGIVVPVTIKTEKQKAAVEKILTGLTERTAALAQAAKATGAAAPFTPIIIVRQNAMQAVMSHAATVLPAWVTGICLDLAPLALLLLITIKSAADRGRPDEAFQRLTVGEVLSLRRALAEFEPQPPVPPQRRPLPRGFQT